MPITRVDKDLEAHRMTVVAEYDAPVERGALAALTPTPASSSASGAHPAGPPRSPTTIFGPEGGSCTA